MDRLETRTQLINAIADSGISYAVRNACSEGVALVLGGFRCIPPFQKSGWIVNITSRFGRTWTIAVMTDEVNLRYIIELIEDIPWVEYIGKNNGVESIYNGDEPDTVRNLRDRHATT